MIREDSKRVRSLLEALPPPHPRKPLNFVDREMQRQVLEIAAFLDLAVKSASWFLENQPAAKQTAVMMDTSQHG